MKATLRNIAIALVVVPTFSCAESVQVEGVGRSIDQARQDGFKQAIQQSVGSVVVGEQEQRDGRLVRDYTGNYSSGVVNHYDILDSYQDDAGLWHVDMTVDVSPSKIANRMLAKPGKDILVQGDQIQAQMDSRLEQRADGDALLGTVLANYPQQAYVINNGKTEFSINKLRQPYVDVPYNITMNKEWVTAFDEALKAVSVDSASCNNLTRVFADGVAHDRTSATVKRLAGRACGAQPDVRVFSKSGFIPTSNSYYLPDLETLHTINDELQPATGQQHMGLVVDMLDASGNTIDSRCARINNELFVFYEKPSGAFNLRDKRAFSRPSIMGQNNVYGTLRVHIKDVNQLQDLAKIKLNLQRTCS